MAYASGGLWETKTNGQSFEPLFDNEIVMTIGDIAIDWENDNIWIGSGEVNSSRSSYAGMGVFMSEDHGKTWVHKGLSDTQHIGKILIHPTDPNVIWVASLGHLYSDLGEAGVFMSEDGGTSWNQRLTAARAGAVDLIIHPSDPSILYASLWERSRKSWGFKGNGPDSGIFRSQDGGQSFYTISEPATGFPSDEGTGRIGLALAVDKDGEHLYAFHDNQGHRSKEEDSSSDTELKKGDFVVMSKEDFLLLDKEALETFLSENDFPKELDYTHITKKIEADEISPKALFDYLTDANSDLFDTPVIGAEVWKFHFGSKSWKKTHEGYLDNVVYSYGYYFGMIEVNPSVPQELYIAGVPIIHSVDGGATWTGINADNVHVDHHVLWVNPERPGHLINGNDGGVNISYDNGLHYTKCNSPAVGQFYTVNVDDDQPYNIYGGLQDNGVWKGPSTYQKSPAWHQNGKYPWEFIMGGDGMQIEIDSRDGTIYTGFQFGHYYRQSEGENHYFHPRHELGERPLRWNWQTPIHLSEHNQDILYMGSNKVHRSLDRAENFSPISGDLTKGGRKGNVPYGTLTSIDESAFTFGRLIVGSDDGRVHLSPDGGVTWNDISKGLAEDLWVSRVWFSRHEEERVYVSLNGYRWDDHKAYIYVSDDSGTTWQDLSAGLPNECVNVFKEDKKIADILYVGTDHGLYISVNAGDSFEPMTNGLPAVPVHDLVVQEREGELVIATHGRSIYVADLSMIRMMASGEEMLLVTCQDSLRVSDSWGKTSWFTQDNSTTKNLVIEGYKKLKGPAELQLKSAGGLVLWSDVIAATEMGVFNRSFDLSLAPALIPSLEKEIRKRDKDRSFSIEAAENEQFRLPEGKYTLSFKAGEQISSTTIVIH